MSVPQISTVVWRPFNPSWRSASKWLLALGLACLTIDSNAFPQRVGQTSIDLENPHLLQQRKLYQQAEDAFKKKQSARFQQLSSQLKHYPLYPYLQYKQLIKNRDTLTRQQISQFLQAQDDSVIGDRFRVKLIKHTAKRKRWQQLIDIYRPGYGVTMECHYLSALVHTGKSALAYPRIQSLWLSANSQPDSCDPAFKHWKNAGLQTPAIIWQRFELAMSISNRKLARYLMKSMTPQDRHIANKWLQVHRKPELITSHEILSLKHQELNEILMHGIKRLSYKDIDQAIQIYHQLGKQRFSNDQQAQLNRHIGLRLARTHMPDAGIWLNRVADSHVDKHVTEWRIRTAIRQGDWSYVLKGIAQLDLNKQSDYRWQYWWAHANEQLGNTDDAMGIYQYLAGKRSYYGFLAADHLNLNYAFEDRPVEVDSDVSTFIHQQAEVLRAHEFYQLGKIIPARREWQRLIRRINTPQKLAASKLAQSWNWHDRAIITMGRTRYRDDIELRFPLEHDEKVLAWSSKRNINPAWTYAIIRRESAFMLDARSSVGALGLMQLMPNTARYVARKLKMRYRGRHSLLSSNTNIRLGTGYLERMLDKLSQQQVLATAAYNAGPHRVENWLPETRNMDAIRWIETIPFTETREYVSNVLAYMVIYEHRMNRQVTRLSQRMPPVPAKNPTDISQVETKAKTPQTPSITQRDTT